MNLARSFEVPLQLRGARGLAHQIKLIEYDFFVLRDHPCGPQPPPLAPVALREVGKDIQQAEIAADNFFDPRPHDFDHHVAAVQKLCRVDLGDRSRGQGLLVEFAEDLQ